MSFFDSLRQPISAALGMSNCSFCGLGKTLHGVCEPCLSAIELTGDSCSRCASMVTLSPNNSHTQPHCGECIEKPPAYQKVITATRYKFPVDKALSELKFNNQLHYARSLGNILVDKVKHEYQDTSLPQVLIPIPLHPRRLSERGFNQSLVIAKQLSKSLDIPLSHALTRIKDTPHQIGLSEKQRRQNLNGAFHLQQALPDHTLADHIAIIDDVVTTGSTVNEATKLCLKNRVKRVDIWCLAKT